MLSMFCFLDVSAKGIEQNAESSMRAEFVMVESDFITGKVEKNIYQIDENLTDSSMFLTSHTPLSIIGEDDREPLDFPNEVVGKLEITAPNGKKYEGTAFLVAEDLILTAGHCLYDYKMGGFATKMVFKAGLNYDGTYIASANATGSYLPLPWKEKRDSDWDWAILRLDKPIGATVGYEICRVDDNPFGKPCEIVGYGVNYEPDTVQLTGFGNILKYSQYRLYYDADTSGGMSGSPIYVVYGHGDYGADIAVSGIHTNGTGEFETRNSGVRITPSLLTVLKNKK